MAMTLLAILVILWLLGIVRIPGFAIHDFSLFTLGGYHVTLLNVLFLIAFMWAVEILPSPLRETVVFLALLWVLSALGIIVIAGLTNLIIVAVGIALVLSLFRGNKS
jgi:hypothetical protein